MKNNQTTKTGLGFTNALTLLFIALKLCNVINWPWVWVLSPLLISLGFAIISLIAYVLMNKPHKPRKAVWCRECKHRGCTVSGMFGVRFHCLKNNKEVPTDHYCMEGIKREKVK